VYVALPENGFTSKVLSVKKERTFMPPTPTKKSFKRVAGLSFEGNLARRFGLDDSGEKGPFSSIKSESS
jgi:hypothetical protein